MSEKSVAGDGDPGCDKRRDLLAHGGADARQQPIAGGPALFSLLSYFLCIHVAIATSTMEMTTNTAESALTSGVTAVLSMP